MTGTVASTMPRIVAAIPVRNAFTWTEQLVTALLTGDEADEVWLFDNGSTDQTADWARDQARQDSRLHIVHRPRSWLYGMWNEMITRASLEQDTYLAILNNDIHLPAGALRAMQQTMTEYHVAFIDAGLSADDPLVPRAVAAHWWQRTGYAFMLRSRWWREQAFAIDPGLRIYWGDDDLARRAHARGGQLCVMEGVGCTHAVSQTQYPRDLRADIEHDRDYFRRIWRD